MILSLTAICLAVIICSTLDSWLNRKEARKIRAEHDETVQYLLNRIQDPTFKPPVKMEMTPAQKREYLERVKQAQEEAEQMGLVGTIQD